MRIFDHEVPERLPDIIGRVGAIVESPKFFPAFTGRKNLSLLAGAIGAPQSMVGQVLEQTSLGDRGKDRFSSYSLGMKQRLAIAATLLKSPDLLIFDEPTNGLDPAGIHEIRTTMRRLGEEGKSVLVSSHILGEVEQVADTVSIIGHGRLLASGTVREVIGTGSVSGLKVGVADQAAATKVLVNSGLAVTPDGQLLHVDGTADGAEITRRLAAHDLWVNELIPVRADLESVFLELTADQGLSQGDTGLTRRARRAR